MADDRALVERAKGGEIARCALRVALCARGIALDVGV